MNRLCPVCWQPVTATGPHENIVGHRDSLRRALCPASSQPFRITLT